MARKTRESRSKLECPKCKSICSVEFKFCDQCGHKIAAKKSIEKKKKRARQSTSIDSNDPVLPPLPTRSWYWGNQVEPTLKKKPREVEAARTNQQEMELPPIHLHVDSVGPETTTKQNLVWGTCLANAESDLKAKEAILLAEISSNTSIIAHMEGQAQAHAFLNDSAFKFACAKKKEVERQMQLDKNSLRKVQEQLDQLHHNKAVVVAVEDEILRIKSNDERVRKQRLDAATRIQLWYRGQYRRKLERSRLRMKVCRGYLRYKYVKRFNSLFELDMYLVHDRKNKESTSHEIEFVGYPSGIYFPPFPVHQSRIDATILLHAATRIQHWIRQRVKKWHKVMYQKRHQAASRLQALFRSRKARKHLRKLIQATYKECIDPATNMVFYFNTKTNQSQWDKPKLWSPATTSVEVKKRMHLTELDTPRRLESAALLIQGLYRKAHARRKLRCLIAETYQKVYDPSSNGYYYFNSKTGLSQWQRPSLLGEHDVNPVEPTKETPRPHERKNKFVISDMDSAARAIQGLYRVRQARRRLVHLVSSTYQKVFDEETKMFYYYNTKTGLSEWRKPKILGSRDIEPCTTSNKQHTNELMLLPTPRRLEVATVKIQGAFRTRHARRRLHALIAQTYQKVLDSESSQYYYYNKKTGESQWLKPRLIGTKDLHEVQQTVNTPRPRKSVFDGMDTPRRIDVAVIKIQGLFRSRNARRQLRDLISKTVQKVFDADAQQYYYYNTKTGESQWTKPVLLKSQDIDEACFVKGDPSAFIAGLDTARREDVCARKLQGLFRVRNARRRLRLLIAQSYQKFVDTDSNTCYYYNTKTGESSWTKPVGLGSTDLAAQ